MSSIGRLNNLHELDTNYTSTLVGSINEVNSMLESKQDSIPTPTVDGTYLHKSINGDLEWIGVQTGSGGSIISLTFTDVSEGDVIVCTIGGVQVYTGAVSPSAPTISFASIEVGTLVVTQNGSTVLELSIPYYSNYIETI